MGKRGKQPNLERITAIVNRYHECRNLRDTAATFSITHQAVSQVLKKVGVDTNPSGRSSNPAFAGRLHQIIERCKEVKSVPRVAAEFGVSQDSLYWVLKKEGVRIKPFKNPEESFWLRVDRRDVLDCWLWTGGKHKRGYGAVAYRIDGRWQVMGAHRLAWYLTHRSLPTGELNILHKCGIALCCNPTHLRIGTRQENDADRILHHKIGRGPQAVAYFN